MSGASLAELTGRIERLTVLADSVSGSNLIATLDEGNSALGEVPGNPDGLDDLGAGFKRAADHLHTIGTDTVTTATQLPVAWRGDASERATGTMTRVGESIAGDQATLTNVQQVITTLAGNLRALGADLADVRQAVHDMKNQATGLDEDALDQLANDAATLLTRGSDVLKRTADAHRQTIAGLAHASPVDLPLGQNKQRLTHEELLQRYRVADDPNGSVLYPRDGITAWLPDGLVRKNIAAGEADILDRFSFKEQLEFQMLTGNARNTAEEQYNGVGTTDGHTDAFRHAYWNAIMTREYGADWTQEYATAHETVPTPGHDSSVSKAMDLHNNEVGRRIALEHPDASWDELAPLVKQAVDSGEMVVLSKNGRLEYSNQVPLGETWPHEAKSGY